MRVLILGGTRFVGRALTAAALNAGHEVTLFNRGQTNPELFPGVEKVHGDRSADLSPLSGRRWDTVIDVAAYDPVVVELSTSALAESCDSYVFISSLSVYVDQSLPHDEDWPVLALSADTPDDLLYGARKAESERIVQRRFSGRALIVRAGMIVGPGDPTDRLTYWPRRVSRGGRALAPGSPSDPVQFIDVRDLAGWVIRSLPARAHGTFNVTGPSIGIGEVLESCVEVTQSSVEWVWVPTADLLALGVDPWMGVPLWIAAPGWDAANRVDIGRALSAGLTSRSLAMVVRDAWLWDQRRRAQADTPEMFSADTESDLLARAEAIHGVP